MNYVDLIIILVLVYYLINGFFRGFFKVFLELFGFFLAILFALLLYSWVGQLISAKFNFSYNLAKMVGFFAVLFIFQIIYYPLVNLFYRKIPERLEKSWANRLAGLLPASFKGLIFLAIWLSLFVFIPLFPKVKTEIENSRLGKPLYKTTALWESKFEKVFSGAIEETLTFLTTQRTTDKPIQLDIVPLKLSVDSESENKMLDLINADRKRFGLNTLSIDEKLREVARSHSEDMWKRNYFAHNTPEGKTPFDRLKEAGIKFKASGENIALAPNVELAHQGLMQSEEHRENILFPYYKKVGIGIIDGGLYGKMFTQNFTD